MATRRSTRVTSVNPWIAGGEGQLRDLFPLPPWLFLVTRVLSTSFRHYVTTLVFLTSLYLYFVWDWHPLAAFVVFPLSFLLLRTLVLVFYLWYRNPSVPFLSRKPH